MSRSVEMTVLGLSDAMNTLIELQSIGSLKTLARVIRKNAKPLQQEAARLVRVRTGALQSNIRLSVRKPKKGNIVCSVGVVVRKSKMYTEEPIQGPVEPGGASLGTAKVGKKVNASWRWHFIEFGTVNHQAYPYLRPAWDKEASKIPGNVAHDLRKEIAKILKKRQKSSAGGTP